MNAAGIKALAIDLDGTALLPDNSLGGRTIQVLKQLQSRGMQVIICTGRAVESSRHYYRAIGAEGPMVFFNGAEVVDVPAGKVISSNLLAPEIVTYAVDVARSMDIHFQVFLPPAEGRFEMLLIDKQRSESEMYQNHTGITPEVTDLKAALGAPGVKGCPKVMFITAPELHDKIRGKMIERFGGSIYCTRTHPTFLEIMNAGVSKGEGLKTAMECRGLKSGEVIAFGDEENDLPLFTVAGFSAAPSNAREKVKEAADFIFGSNAEEGLAAFLEEHFL